MNQFRSPTNLARAAGAWVVVVEEDQVKQGLVANVLRDAGYRVQTASGATGTHALSSVPPGLIVLGTLPAEQQERALALYPGVPVLALCQTVASTADGYLPAPFTASDLLDAVRVLLVLADARDAAPADTLVDVGAVLEVALRLASDELASRARLTREFDSQLRVRANPEQLCLVFLHLLTAAASRIEAGSPESNGIRVAGWRTAEGRTVVEISDTGSGIGAAHLAAVFDVAVAPDHAGGLGLSASQRVVRANGGAITVTSEVGGTSFRVELPTASA